jgi:hypothetical protein
MQRSKSTFTLFLKSTEDYITNQVYTATTFNNIYIAHNWLAGHFDFIGSSGATLRTHITHIQDDADFNNKCTYSMKDGNCVVRLKKMPAPVPANSAQTDSKSWGGAFTKAIAIHDNPHAVVDAIRKTHVQEYILHYDKILAAAFRVLGPALPNNMYPLSSFKAPFDQPTDFFLDENLKRDTRVMRSIVYSGQAGCGKSARACSEFARPLLVNTVDDLRNIVLSGKHATTHLVFDEYNFDVFFTHVPVKDRVTLAINLLDCKESHTVKARNYDIIVPPLPRFFTTNKEMIWPYCHISPPGANSEEQLAILRRFRTIRITEPVWQSEADANAPRHDDSPNKRLRDQ